MPIEDIDYVTYNDKEYCVFLNTNRLFIIDKDKEYLLLNENNDKQKYRSYFINNCSINEHINEYVVYSKMVKGKTYRYYLHNVIMDEKLFQGKGPLESIDHLNRNGRDNRIENLIKKTSSDQNFNQHKKDRKKELPDGCGINKNDLPKNVYYVPKDNTHSEHFKIEINKKNNEINIDQHSTKNSNVSLRVKLHQCVIFLRYLRLTKPELQNIINIFDDDEINRKELIKSFNKIIMKSKFNDELKKKNKFEFVSDIPCFDISDTEIEQALDNITSLELGKKILKLINYSNSFKTGLTCSMKYDIPVDELEYKYNSILQKINLIDTTKYSIDNLPPYCAYRKGSTITNRGDHFVILITHPKLIKINVKIEMSTSENKSILLESKFDQLLKMLKILESDEILIYTDYKKLHDIKIKQHDLKQDLPESTGLITDHGKRFFIIYKSHKTLKKLNISQIKLTSSNIAIEQKYEQLIQFNTFLLNEKNITKELIFKKKNELIKGVSLELTDEDNTNYIGFQSGGINGSTFSIKKTHPIIQKIIEKEQIEIRGIFSTNSIDISNEHKKKQIYDILHNMEKININVITFEDIKTIQNKYNISIKKKLK
jgi:hypothetical protein